jgi:hypothetical protein
MNINAYAYDLDQNLWFYAGSVYLSRKVGKDNNNTDWISTHDLFDVNFCTVVDPGPPVVCEDAIQELSVFDPCSRVTSEHPTTAPACASKIG